MIASRTVVIDSGHGGRDPGAIGPSGLREADVTLELGLLVKSRLEKRGISVVLTRTEDADVSLARRCEVANRSGAAVFVSLHCNAAVNTEAHGTETYHLEGSSAGRVLATQIHRRLVTLGLRDRGLRTAGHYVLKHTRMPAALVEVAFITHPAEEAKLASAGFQNAAAEAIAEGIRAYLEEG